MPMTSNLKFLDLEQGSAPWLEYRRSRVGASEASAICGKDPWTSPLMVFESKIEGKQKEQNDDMRRGHEREPFVRRMVCEQYNRKYQPVVVENAKYPFGFASLDGWDTDADIKVLEIKCPRKHAPSLPDYHYMQLQWQLMITEEKEALYVSYDGDEIMELIIKRDEETISLLEREGRAFFSRLNSFDPPPATDKDYQVIDDPVASEEARILSNVKMEIAKLEETEKALTARLKEKCNGRSSKIGEFKYTRYMMPGRVDTKALAEAAKLNQDDFRKKPIEAWRFS